jgi:hypothetical protein
MNGFPYTDDQLAAMDWATIHAAWMQHTIDCNDCNYAQGERCPCQWADDEITNHNCACWNGPGNGARMSRYHEIARRAWREAMKAGLA